MRRAHVARASDLHTFAMYVSLTILLRCEVVVLLICVLLHRSWTSPLRELIPVCVRAYGHSATCSHMDTRLWSSGT